LGLPVYLLAHSMGGHIALRFMSRYPLKIERAVLASPMVEIAMPPWLEFVSKRLSKKISKSSLFAGKYAFGSKDYSGREAKFKGNNLSHDPEQFQVLHHEIKKNPDLALGGVTWGWLNAAFESIEFLKQADVIAKITTPILLLSAQEDSVVSPSAQEKLSRQLPCCRIVSIGGAFHELLFEDADIRGRVWDALEQFIPT
jgi:lysophospholipase